MFSAADADGSGGLDLDEVVALIKQRSPDADAAYLLMGMLCQKIAQVPAVFNQILHSRSLNDAPPEQVHSWINGDFRCGQKWEFGYGRVRGALCAGVTYF